MFAFAYVEPVPLPPGDEARPPPEITQKHVDIVCWIARRLVREHSVAYRVGLEELESQALLILWEQALAWDPSRDVPFEAFLYGRVRFRLLDWLRFQHGRVHGDVVPSKMLATLLADSIDEMHEYDDHHYAHLVDSGPGPEQIVEDRDELERLVELVGYLLPEYQDSLLWPLEEGGAPAVMEQWGVNRNKVGSWRLMAKEIAYAILDRPVQKRSYVWRDKKVNPVEGSSRELLHDEDPGSEAATGASNGRAEVLPEGPAGCFCRLLDMDGRLRLGRVRTALGQDGPLPRPPVGVRAASRANSGGSRDRPPVSREAVCESCPSRGRDSPGEHAATTEQPGHRRAVSARPSPRRDAQVLVEPATVVLHGLRCHPAARVQTETRGARRGRMIRAPGHKKHTLRYIPDEQLIEDRRTMTLREMAAKYDVSHSTVSVRMKRLGCGIGNRPRYRNEIPWKVNVDHDQDRTVVCLRMLGRYRAGMELEAYEVSALRRFVRKCLAENVVADYDYEKGFGFRPSGVLLQEEHPYYARWLVEDDDGFSRVTDLAMSEFRRHRVREPETVCVCGYESEDPMDWLRHVLEAVVLRTGAVKAHGVSGPRTYGPGAYRLESESVG